MNFFQVLISLALIIAIGHPITACLFSKSQNEEAEIKSPSFSPANFIVRFSPYVDMEDSPKFYRKDDLLPMITKIATLFSSVLAPRIRVIDEGDSLTHVAPAVATFNKRHSKDLQPALKVFMSFELDEERDTQGTNLTSLDLVHQAMEEANSIFPGTVEYLLLQQTGLEESHLDKLTNLLLTAEEKIAGSYYKLGGIFPFKSCGMEEADGDDGNLASYLTPLMGHLKLVIFHLWPEQRDYHVGAEETVTSFSSKFEECKEKVGRLYPSMEVGFQTRWPDTDFNGIQNYSGLVSFWSGMNDWGMKSNTKVFMLDAFDNPFRASITETEGWWRLKSRRRHHGSSTFQDVFETKMEAGMRGREGRSGEKNSGEASMSPVLISILVASGFLFLVCGGGFLLYRKVNRKIENQAQILLTKAERNEFFFGSQNGPSSPPHPPPPVEEGTSQGAISSLMIAYNKQYELKKKSFTIDDTSILGSGNFGIVCRGTVWKGREVTNVAVKMLKNTNSATALKDLLTEIKTQSYLGQHENIVSLVGAYTQELKKGLVYVFTELCEKGSLEKHLRARVPKRYSEAPGHQIRADEASGFIGSVEPSRALVSFSSGRDNSVGQQLLRDLYKWSYQIANGMAYLVSKKVVHGDLAARNVLLTQGLTAKISDFGFSRRLYDYQSYVKSQQAQLPWRSLPPESLCRGVFNEKSDVWAYGITLWEIYSLGDQPYPGLSWTADYATLLQNGLRPTVPQYDADDMYARIMLQCWNIDPAHRPSFSHLRASLAFK